MKIIHNILLALTFALLGCTLSACHSSKVASTDNLPKELRAVAEDVTSLNKKEAEKVVAQISKDYFKWQSLSLDAKAKMDKLPIDPSAKVYMEKGKEIIISLRVPLLGEVGRIEVTTDSLKVFNKPAKAYCCEYIGGYLSDTRTTLNDVQDIMLGRIFILGKGTLSTSIADDAEITFHPSTGWIVTPKKQPAGAVYGFTVYPDGKTQVASVMGNYIQCNADAVYQYDNDNTIMSLTFDIEGKQLSMDLSYSKPNLKPKAIAPLQINSKWTKMSLRQLLKSF